MKPISNDEPDYRGGRSPVLKLVLLLLTILLVLGLVLGTIILKQGPGEAIQTVKLPDGSKIEVLKVRSGKSLKYDTAPLLEQWIQKLPKPVRSYFFKNPSTPMSAGDGMKDHLFIIARYSSPPHLYVRWTLRNAEGLSVTREREGEQYRPGTISVLVPFDSLPGNSPVFDLIAETGWGSYTAVATFQITNPLYKPPARQK